MHKIRDWLYVGSIRDTLNGHDLKQAQIGAMLQLYELVEQPGIETLFLAIEEGVPLTGDDIVQGLTFVRAARNRGLSVLIACGAGISRSVALATAALKEAEQLSLLDAFHQIRLRHPNAMPDQVHWLGLCRYYNDPNTYRQLWQGTLE